MLAAANSAKPGEALDRLLRGRPAGDDDPEPEGDDAEGDFDNSDEHWRGAWAAAEAATE